jgi:FkbM family methyltransferase
MLDILQSIGLLDRPILYPVGGSIEIAVPVIRTRMDLVDVGHYENSFISRLADHIRQIPDRWTLIDAGADFGLFSLKLLSMCSTIGRIIAFEPNGEAYPILKYNFDRLHVSAEAIPKALADFEGFGRLRMPSQDIAELSEWPLDHAARFLEASPDGPIEVTSVDALAAPTGAGLILKLDIEGGELAAIRGASRTIAGAANMIVGIEANPLVSRRMGIDPVECLRLLAETRKFTFIVAETNKELSISLPVFEQVPQEICNVICISPEYAGQPGQKPKA